MIVNVWFFIKYILETISFVDILYTYTHTKLYIYIYIYIYIYMHEKKKKNNTIQIIVYLLMDFLKSISYIFKKNKILKNLQFNSCPQSQIQTV